VKRAIITGGNGFIGKHLVKKIFSCKLDSLALISNTNITDKYLSDGKLAKDMSLRFYTADIRDGKEISDIFSREKADTCIHLAAKTSVPDSIRHPDETMEINVQGTLNVLEGCYNSEVNNFVFASSAAVYGDVRQLPISENCILRPLSPYGTSKMLAEQHVLSYNKLKKIQNTISLRIFNVYGNGQVRESDVVTKFARRLSKGLPPVIYGNGKYTRDFISVDDVVDSILLSINAMEESKDNHNAMEESKDNHNYNLSSSPVFNIGTGTATSINELARQMISISGLQLNPVYLEGGEDSGVILHSYADVTKAKKALSFVAKTNLETGLREIIELEDKSKSAL
jgi:UDP-glucose 4-epimerase